MKVKIIPLKEVELNSHVGEWCQLPYLGHPHGCPNYNKKLTCPPNALDFKDLVKPPFTLVGVRFDLESHAKRMLERHPEWSERQCRCLLYWQGRVNKHLREACEKVASQILNSRIVYVPEANGVQVFNTCFKVGLILERPPRKYVWKIAIIGKEVDANR